MLSIQYFLCRFWPHKKTSPSDILVTTVIKHLGKGLFIKVVPPKEGNVIVVLDGVTREIKNVYMADSK